MSEKICSKCKTNHPIEMYGIIKKKIKSGEIKQRSKSQCRNCQSLIQKERRIIQQKENPEEFHKRWNASYQKRKDRMCDLAKIRLSNPENREKRREYIRKYKANKRLSDPSFKINENHRKRIWKCLKKKNNSSKELLGCDIELYFKWITFAMSIDKNMVWENYGKYWNIDHVKPISTFNLLNDDEAKNAFNWKNTWAIKSSDNFSKKNTIIEDHIIEQQKLLDIFIQTNNLNKFNG